MNAIELLKKDHKTVKSLFQSFEKAKEQEEETSKAELFASIKEELDAHARVEEEVFYPAFDRAAEEEDDKELVLEAGEEHKQVKTLLAELSGLSPDDETFDAKMKVLKDNVEHHVEEEEGEMFPHAQKQLGSEQLEELGNRIAALKEQIQSGQPSGRAASARSTKTSPGSRARTTTPTRRSLSKSNAADADDTSGRGAARTSASRSSRSGAGSSGSRSRSSSASRSASGASRSSGGRASTGRSSGSTAGGSRSSSSRGRSSSSRGRSSSGRTSTQSRRGSTRRSASSSRSSSRSRSR